MNTVALPRAPRNASPVPHLTSIHSALRRGEYGSHTYPGNCGGYLIRDLLRYFDAQLVFDPMTGSGTCKDVCTELGVPCVSGDLTSGYDATDKATMPTAIKFDFIWLHPPYWRQKVYSNDPRDLSSTRTLEAFLEKLSRVIVNCRDVLIQGGRMAILMGDYFDKEVGFVPLTYYTKRLCFEAGLIQRCTEIVRFQHGNSSSKKTYATSFIPGIHDICLIVEKPVSSPDFL